MMILNLFIFLMHVTQILIIITHMQKYRAHRKHWTQRKQMYDGAIAIGGGGKRVIMNPWSAPPTMGFPPMAHHIRPLHVWGHPYVNNSFWHPHYQGVSSFYIYILYYFVFFLSYRMTGHKVLS